MSRKMICPIPFPYKKGVWLDFQVESYTLKLSVLENAKNFFTSLFELYDYANDLEFPQLIGTNIMELIFDEIGVNKFLLMSKPAKRTLLHIMFLQVGGFNPYDFHTPYFSQYTTESIAKNLFDAFDYHEKIHKSKKKKLEPELCEEPKDMLKALFRNFKFEQALYLWTCYKYLRWSTDHKNLLKILDPKNLSEQPEDDHVKLIIKLLKYFYLFYGLIDESLVLKTVLTELDSKNGYKILEICLEGKIFHDLKLLKELLLKFYSVLFEQFDLQAL